MFTKAVPREQYFVIRSIAPIPHKPWQNCHPSGDWLLTNSCSQQMWADHIRRNIIPDPQLRQVGWIPEVVLISLFFIV
jgi:hypothetical protein